MAGGRAKAGGEVGKNGEFYKGGSFLPSTQLPKRGATARKVANDKTLISPGVLGFVPDGQLAVFRRLSSIVQFDDDGKAVALADDSPAITHYFDSSAEMHALVDLYNRGVLFYNAALIANLTDKKDHHEPLFGVAVQRRKFQE
jgi:hypothetical protein